MNIDPKKIEYLYKEASDLVLLITKEEIINLFYSLMKKSEVHKSKESLLNEIDDAIMNAY